MVSQTNPISNPMIVLREEFDDWAILFDPDSGDAFGLDPVGVFIWKKLDGRHTLEDIKKEVCVACRNVPSEAGDHIKEFVEDLTKNGLAGYEI